MRRSGRLAAGLLVALSVLTAPAVARGQVAAGWYLEPSLSLTEEYDDNLFGQPSGKQSDFVTRLTLGLGAGYRSAPFTLFGSYFVGSELYAETSELNGFANRQDARLEVGYLPIPSLSFRLLGYYNRSETSTVALAPTLASTPAGPTGPGAQGAAPAASGAGAPPPGVPAVEVGASRSTTINVQPTASYAFTPRTSVETGYAFTGITTSPIDVPSGATGDGGTEPTPREDTRDLQHEAYVRLVYQLGPLDRGTVGYRFRYFDSDQAESSTSHVPTVGWYRDLTEATTVFLEVGPRFTDGDTDVEAQARLEHRFRAVRVALAYVRSEGLVVGRSGAQTTDTGSVELAYQPLRELLLSLGAGIVRASSEPSADRNDGGNGAATGTTGSEEDQLTYRIGAGLAYRLTEWLTAHAAYSFSLQEDGDETIRHHIGSVGLTLSYPFRVR